MLKRACRVSGKKALQDAGLDPEQDAIKNLDKGRCGILIGSAMGGMTSFSNAVEALISAGQPTAAQLLPCRALLYR